MNSFRNDLFPYSEETWANIVAHIGLSPQHAKLAKCLFYGMGDKQIASDMNLSGPTVRTYIGRIGKQLGANGRLEIMLRIVAIREKII